MEFLQAPQLFNALGVVSSVNRMDVSEKKKGIR